MKKLAILMIGLLACAGVQERVEKREYLLKQIDRFLSSGMFQVLVECRTDEANGKIKIERGLGNAFLVDKNTLVSVAHLFRDTTEKKCIVTLRNQETVDTKAEIRILDTIFDVAILEARVTGTPFKLREHEAHDKTVYVSGLWFYRQKDTIYGVPYLVQSTINKDASLANDLLLPLLGMFAHGMSGSAVIAPDGQVVGIFTKVGANKSPSARGKAAMTKHILSNLNFYKNQMRGSGGKNEK